MMSMEASTATGVIAPAPVASSAKTLACARCGSKEPEGSGFCGSCGAPLAATAVAPPPAAPPAPPLDPAPPPPAVAAPPARRRMRVQPMVLSAAVVLLIGGGAAAALLGTGVIGGKSKESEGAFVLRLNEKVLGPLGRADAIAAEHASTTDGAIVRAADGGRIVRVANEASVYLRGLNGLSGRQKSELVLVLQFVAANQRYGQAFAAFTPTNTQSQTALEGTAAAVRALAATVRSHLPVELRLPSQAAFISLPVASAPPSTTTPSTTPAPDVTGAYVQQVDDLLSRSHTVVLALRSFVPRARSDAISRSAAVTAARSYLRQRNLQLAQAQALTVPRAFASAQGLLIRSLQASVADDRALIAWTVARRDGSGNEQAEFDSVNRIGAHATTLKQQFLHVYGRQRQAATGRSPASLPDTF